MTRLMEALKKVYLFYEENLAFLLMLLFVDSFVVGIAAAVPYLNWFLDTLPLILLAFDWIVILVWFRPKSKTVFYALALLLALMLLMQLISFERFMRQVGVLAFGLVLTIVIKQITSTNSRDEE